MKNIFERFIEKIEKSSDPEGCWNWKASLRGGYGQFKVAGKMVLSHRFSFELFKGEIPAGLCVCHTCDNPACVNPNHLFLGTHAENMADKVKKNRQSRLKGTEHPQSKLSEEQVLQIRELYATGNFSQRQLAKQFGVVQAQIYRIINRKKWTHLK